MSDSVNFQHWILWNSYTKDPTVGPDPGMTLLGLSTNNPDGVEPLPDAIAANEKFTQSLFIPVSGTSRIRFRVINGASLSMYKFSIDSLPLHIIELDQTNTVPYNVTSFVINVAQRVSFYIDLSELDPIYS
ncbi:unnamed protein product [Rotaria socialis]